MVHTAVCFPPPPDSPASGSLSELPRAGVPHVLESHGWGGREEGGPEVAEIGEARDLSPTEVDGKGRGSRRKQEGREDKRSRKHFFI